MTTDPGKSETLGSVFPSHHHSPTGYAVTGLSSEWTPTMFSHLARFAGGPKDGQSCTIPSEDETPPPVLFAAVEVIPGSGIRFERARYERAADGHYEYAGSSR